MALQRDSGELTVRWLEEVWEGLGSSLAVVGSCGQPQGGRIEQINDEGWLGDKQELSLGY